MSKPTLYQFEGSVWVKAPLIAIIEGGNALDDFEIKRVNLAEGANFDPEYLAINENGTVPTLITKDGKLTNSTAITAKILSDAPNAPKADSPEVREILEAVHSPALDPNDLFVLPTDDDDRQAKATGFQGSFIKGRQNALDRFTPDAPAEFATFLQEKQKGNGALLAFYNGGADQTTQDLLYGKAKGEWAAAANLIRGDVTELLRKNPGKFLGGERPGETDIHLITWLARIITDAGATPGSASGAALAAVEKKTGQKIDGVVADYWDSWISRPSFKENHVF